MHTPLAVAVTAVSSPAVGTAAAVGSAAGTVATVRSTTCFVGSAAVLSLQGEWAAGVVVGPGSIAGPVEGAGDAGAEHGAAAVAVIAAVVMTVAVAAAVAGVTASASDRKKAVEAGEGEEPRDEGTGGRSAVATGVRTTGTSLVGVKRRSPKAAVEIAGAGSGGDIASGGGGGDNGFCCTAAGIGTASGDNVEASANAD